MNLYNQISTDVYNTIKQYGQPVKILSISGSSISTYGVWGKSSDAEVSSEMTGNITVKTRELYIPYIKTSPEVGGSVIVNKVTYAISSVTLYQPTDKAVGFKVEVQG